MKLSSEGGELGALEFHGKHLVSELLGFEDLEGLARGHPRDDVGVLLVGENLEEL